MDTWALVMALYTATGSPQPPLVSEEWCDVKNVTSLRPTGDALTKVINDASAGDDVSIVGLARTSEAARETHLRAMKETLLGTFDELRALACEIDARNEGRNKQGSYRCRAFNPLKAECSVSI